MVSVMNTDLNDSVTNWTEGNITEEMHCSAAVFVDTDLERFPNCFRFGQDSRMVLKEEIVRCGAS